MGGDNSPRTATIQGSEHYMCALQGSNGWHRREGGDSQGRAAIQGSEHYICALQGSNGWHRREGGDSPRTGSNPRQ